MSKGNIDCASFVAAVQGENPPKIAACHMSRDAVAKLKSVKYSGVTSANDVSYHAVHFGQNKLNLVFKNGQLKFNSARNTHTDGEAQYAKKKTDGISICEFNIPFDVEKQNNNQTAITYLQAVGVVDNSLIAQATEAIKENEVNTDNHKIIPVITKVYGSKTSKKDANGKSMAGKPLESGPYITHSVKLLDVEGVNPKNSPHTKILDANSASIGPSGVTFSEFKLNGVAVNGNNFKEIMNLNTEIVYMKVDFEVIQSGGGISMNTKVQEMVIDYKPRSGGGEDTIQFDDEFTEMFRQRALAKAAAPVVDNNNNNNNVQTQEEPVIIEGSVDGATQVSADQFMNL
jgi:hypothetical protein